ncbi:MAG: vWA domain-containing protein, partial [Vampirovibrionales bacterium]|nr:vWA domain-containing protein [Vampirovibrionales bacterium]
FDIDTPRNDFDVPISAAVPYAGSRLVFKNFREKAIWINRFDASPPGNDSSQSRSLMPYTNRCETRLDSGLQNSAAKLTAAASGSDPKIMILITDGYPTGSITFNSSPSLFDLAREQLAANNIQLITVGFFIDGDPNLDDNLKRLAEVTPNGKFYNVNANTVKSLGKNLATEISRRKLSAALCANLWRYGIKCQ